MKKIIVFLLLVQSIQALAKLNVVTSTPDLSYLVREVGGDLVEVDSFLDGREDIHFVEASPHFILKASRADILCFVGMSLDNSWISKVIERSANAKISKGGKGFCEVGSVISAIQVPKGKIDRSMGDVHSEGNPHFHLSPDKMIEASELVLSVLLANLPGQKDTLFKNQKDLKAKLEKIKEDISKKLAPLKKTNFMEYHKSFSYFFNSYGLSSVMTLEDVPGVSPSAGRIVRASLQAKKESVSKILACEHNDQAILEKFSETSGIKFINLPQGLIKGELEDYRKLQEVIAKGLLGK